jgi:hypothetical protein
MKAYLMTVMSHEQSAKWFNLYARKSRARGRWLALAASLLYLVIDNNERLWKKRLYHWDTD